MPTLKLLFSSIYDSIISPILEKYKFEERRVLLHRDRLRKWDPESVTTRQLRFLVESRRNQVDEATAVSNRITALLKEFYPAALQMVGQLKTALACDFLKRWSNLPALQRARSQQLKKFYDSHNCRSSQNINKRIALAATAQPLIQEKEMIRTYSLLLASQVEQMKVLMAGIERLERETERVFANHQDADIYNSFPAAGPALAPRLAAVLGEDRAKFDSAVAVLNLTGVAPVTIRSRKSKIVAFRLGAPKFQRQTFLEFARVSIQYSVWARQDYLAYRRRETLIKRPFAGSHTNGSGSSIAVGKPGPLTMKPPTWQPGQLAQQTLAPAKGKQKREAWGIHQNYLTEKLRCGVTAGSRRAVRVPLRYAIISGMTMSDKKPEIESNPVVEAYKKDVDRTLIRENLKLTVEQRFEKLMKLQEFADALRNAPRQPVQKK